jgi:hypothetical protein
MKINNKIIVVKDYDSLETYITRVSNEYDTLPKYLIWTPELSSSYDDFKKKDKYEIIDLLDELKKTKSFVIFYNNFKLQVQNKFEIKQLFELYLYVNKSSIFEKSYDFILNFITAEILEFNKTFENETTISLTDENIKNIIDERKNIEQKINEDKKNNKEFIANLDNDYDITSIKSSKININRKIFNIILKNDKYGDIYDIFNSIYTTQNIPIIFLNDLYKIDENLVDIKREDIVNENYSRDKFKNLVTNISDIIVFRKKYQKQYVNILLYILDNNININFDLINIENEKNDINEILNILNLSEKDILDYEDKVLLGEFYMLTNKTQSFNKVIFNDLIFTNRIFQSYGINTIETQYTSTKKKYLHVHFNIPGINMIKVNIYEKNLNNKVWSNFSKEDYDDDTNNKYILIKILNSKSYDNINTFINIMKKVISIYNEEYNNIYNIYKMYIPSFDKDKKKKEEKDGKSSVKFKLKDIEPDIFTDTYPRTCGSKKYPIAYTKDNFKRQFPDGLDDNKYLIFPKEDDAKKLGKQSRYYVCEHNIEDNNIYPGFIINKDYNKNEYPYIPCCFKKPNQKWDEYYEGKKKIKTEQQIIAKKKLCDNAEEGLLPDDLIKLFNILIKENKSNESFIRKGVYLTTNSLINCLLNATTKETIIGGEYLSKEETESKIKNIKKEFIKDEYISLCRQQLYDLTHEQIKSRILDDTKYFDPKLFIHLVEQYFKVKVFIFSKLYNNDVELELPRFVKFYTDFYKKRNIVLIYERDNHCELIAKKITINEKKDENKFIFNFDYNDELSINLRSIYNNLHKFYNFNNLIINPIIPTVITRLLISQVIDEYGKTRVLNLRYNDMLIDIITTPLPNLFIKSFEKSIQEYKFNIINYDQANEFILKVLNISEDMINKQINEKNEIVSIDFSINNLKMSIPIYSKNQSELFEYKKYDKLSRIITEYFIILYSKYCKDNDIDKSLFIKNKTIKEFTEKYIKIDNTIDYNLITSNKYNFIDSIFYKDSKLILKSLESLKRLVFILQKQIINNENLIFNYYRSDKYITNFYNKLFDYSINNQIVFKGIDSIIDWFNIKNYSNIIIDCPTKIKNIVNNTFFYNEKINKDIYIIYEIKNLNQFLDFSEKWNKKSIIDINNISEINGSEIITNNKDKFILTITNDTCSDVILKLANNTSEDVVSPSKLLVLKNSLDSIKYYALLNLEK